MELLETMYHLSKVSCGTGKTTEYRFTHRSGKPTKLDLLINADTVAKLTLVKPKTKIYPFSTYNLSVDGESPSVRFSRNIFYWDKVGSGTGKGIDRKDIFQDNCLIIIDDDSLFLYMHKKVRTTSLPSKAGTSDETTIFIKDVKDSPHRKFLSGDKRILSEMNFLSLDATRV